MGRGVQTWGIGVVLVALASLCVWLYFDCRRLERFLAQGVSHEAPVEDAIASQHIRVQEDNDELEELLKQIEEKGAEHGRLWEQYLAKRDGESAPTEIAEITMAELAERMPDLYAVVAEEVAAYHAILRNTQPVVEGVRRLEGLGFVEPEWRQRCEDYVSQYNAYAEGVLDNEFSDEAAEERLEVLVEQKNVLGDEFEQIAFKAMAAMLDVEGEEEVEKIMSLSFGAADTFLSFAMWWNTEEAAVYAQLRELEPDFPGEEEPELDEGKRKKLREMAELLEKRREP